MEFKPFDYDRLVNASGADVAQTIMTIADRVQTHKPEARVLGSAAFFLMTCEHLGVVPQDAFTAITNLMHHKDGQKPEFKAVRMYVENEL